MSYQQVNTISFIKRHRLIYMIIGGLILILLTINKAMGEADGLMIQSIYLEPETEFHFVMGTDSLYMDQGRNQLDDGGIVWGHAQWQLGSINAHSSIGRGTHQDYTEWNSGMELKLLTTAEFEVTVGVQFTGIFGRERESDIELSTSLSYEGRDWFTSSIDHTYSLDTHGHFVELSLQGKSLVFQNGATLTPYVTQAFDFEFVVDDYNGLNHFQMGIQAAFPLNQRITIFGHLSHITPQKGIKHEASSQSGHKASTYARVNHTAIDASATDVTSKQIFAGVYFSWYFP